MKRINKSEPPKFFKDFIRKNNPVNWDGIHEIKHDLREHILKSEQVNQCAYCESAITSFSTKSHIDHFKRKHYFPELTFDYNNLLVSCKNHNHCASTKDQKVKSRDFYKSLINPVIDEPSDYFDYQISGKLVSINKKAKFTIEAFNLNHTGLKQQRNNISWAVQSYKSSLGLEEVIEQVGEFESFIRAIW
ncbi:MAG: TIGR02646 family protein [Chlorobi bacterium]|nr:TIGR02646 family protein [Chlorobiota bacterium]